MSELLWPKVLLGVAVAAAVAIPAGIVQRVVGEGSSVSLLLTLVIAVGAIAGGFVAGRPQPQRGLTAGGVAGALFGLAVLVANVVIALTRGRSPNLIAGIAIALLMTSLGLIGGWLAFRRDARDREETAA